MLDAFLGARAAYRRIGTVVDTVMAVMVSTATVRGYGAAMGFRHPITTLTLAPGAAPVRQVITAPPAPQRRQAPHNLFTLAEVVAALQLLVAGTSPIQQAMVTVTWRSGGSRTLRLDDVTCIADVEQVTTVSLHWQYLDGSSVQGTLVSCVRRGELIIEHGGAALAATGACLDYLETLRPQRARFRAFVAGSGVDAVLALMAVLGLASLWWTRPVLEASVFAPRLRTGSLIALLVESVFYLWVMRRIHRSTAGTHLARAALVQRTWLTTELGVLIGLATLVATVAFGLLTLVAG